MRHPSISRQEGDTLPGKSGTIRPPSKVPRIARRHGCRNRLKIRPPTRAPSTNAKQSTLNKALPHTNPDSPCQHSASFETPRQNQIGTLKNVKIRKVVASCSLETPIHVATRTTTLSRGSHGTIRPFHGPENCPTPRVPDTVKEPPAFPSTSNERETTQTHQSCSLIPIQARRVNTALHLETPRQESDRYFKLLKLKGGRELFSRDTHPFRDRNGDTLPGKIWDQQPCPRSRE